MACSTLLLLVVGCEKPRNLNAFTQWQKDVLTESYNRTFLRQSSREGKIWVKFDDKDEIPLRGADERFHSTNASIEALLQKYEPKSVE